MHLVTTPGVSLDLDIAGLSGNLCELKASAHVLAMASSEE